MYIFSEGIHKKKIGTTQISTQYLKIILLFPLCDINF